MPLSFPSSKPQFSFSFQERTGFPTIRLRRTRQHEWLRRLVAETRLSVDDLILPLFVREEDMPQEISSMPGVVRYRVQELSAIIKKAVKLKIPAIALFPVISLSKRSEDATEAFNSNNILCQAIKMIKDTSSEIGIITDVAFDAFTSHGHDGLMNGTIVDNDRTLDAIARHALIHAEAGADIIAPSDMMDGRIGVIRQALDQNGFPNIVLMSYGAKYASAFYGPFRDALGSKSCLGGRDKKTYQLSPTNRDEALREIALDLAEGADMVMVKPGLPYLDIVQQVKQTFRCPLFVYHVSGEYAMLKSAAANEWINYNAALVETLIAFKRAGADGILTYAALEMAEALLTSIPKMNESVEF